MKTGHTLYSSSFVPGTPLYTSQMATHFILTMTLWVSSRISTPISPMRTLKHRVVTQPAESSNEEVVEPE